MDLYDANRSRHRKPSTERLLGVATHAPLHENPSSSRRTNGGGDELSEDDVVFLSEDYNEPNHSSTPTSSSASSTPRHHLLHNHKGSGPLDTLGILAALPENEPSSNARNVSHLFHKASVSSTSSSSSRSIPAIPKPPQDRIPLHTSSSSVKYPQSAPVNVPVLSPAMMKARSRRREFDEEDSDEGDEGEEMLPPHEIVARNSAQSPMLAYSVLEGAGRTLKGRDLRQVRNAVWRQTGMKVSVKCEKVKKLGVAATEHDGSFEAKLPSDRPVRCLATLLGGPKQLYASRKDMVSQIVKDKEGNTYTISTPLSFFTKSKTRSHLSSSKTVDLPLPPEWGLAPSSYYVPFFPIIGIP